MATHPDYESQSKYITLKEGDNRLDFSLKPLYSGKFTGFWVKSTATACVVTDKAIEWDIVNDGAKTETFILKILHNDSVWRTHEKTLDPGAGWWAWYDIHYQESGVTHKWQLELYSKTTGKLLDRTDAKYCSVS